MNKLIDAKTAVHNWRLCRDQLKEQSEEIKRLKKKLYITTGVCDIIGIHINPGMMTTDFEPKDVFMQALKLMEHYESVMDELGKCEEAYGKMQVHARKASNQCDELKTEIAELRKAQKWVSVEDRLPENGSPVIVCLKNGYVTTSFYQHLKNAWHYWDGVTHWKPFVATSEEVNDE